MPEDLRAGKQDTSPLRSRANVCLLRKLVLTCTSAGSMSRVLFYLPRALIVVVAPGRSPSSVATKAAPRLSETLLVVTATIAAYTATSRGRRGATNRMPWANQHLTSPSSPGVLMMGAIRRAHTPLSKFTTKFTLNSHAHGLTSLL